MKNLEMPDLYEIFRSCSGVGTDSRKIEKGTMFFALKGENFNGNHFAKGALEQGAAYAVIDDEDVYNANGPLQERLVLVPDVLTSLQQLARYNRLQYKIPVIGLTGTNGKTTTKELITAALSAKYRVVATIGNRNNHIGVPLTLLRIDSQTQVAVIEMGASAPGEINLLASLVCPSFGLITNVGKAHLLGFGSFEGVKAAKGELYDNLMEHKKIAFVNVDNPHLLEMVHHRLKLHIVPYGIKNNCARIIRGEDDTPFLKLMVPNPCIEAACDGEPMEMIVSTSLIGDYNADNVLAALCIATYFDVPAVDAVRAIEEYTPSNNRSQMTRTEHNTLIIDAYNANPTSMSASLENFRNLRAGNKVLVLGDMLELGADSANEHCAIVKLALSLEPQLLLLVGKEFAGAVERLSGRGEIGKDSGRIRLFDDSVLLRDWLQQQEFKGNTILIKGSRGARLERIFDVL